jgi:ammonia channel protein AmtB
MCGTLFDIGNAWECLIVGGLGPFVAIGTAALLRRLGIDDPKVVPLALGPGIVGALLCGFIEWGTRTGGYIGLTGKWAVGVGTITPWWQLAGIAVTVLVSGVPALILCLVFERFGGLRVSEETELLGLDVTQWGVTNFGDDLEGAALARVREQPDAGSAPRGSGLAVADEEGVPA